MKNAAVKVIQFNGCINWLYTYNKGELGRTCMYVPDYLELLSWS